MLTYEWSVTEFAKKVDAAALKQGCTTHDICRRAGMSFSALEIRPRNGLKIESVLRIAATAEIPLEEIFTCITVRSW